MGPPSPASAMGTPWQHPQPSAPWACTVREVGAKTVAKLALHEPRATLVSWNYCLQPDPHRSCLLCTSKDLERPKMGKDTWTSLLPSGLLPT